MSQDRGFFKTMQRLFIRGLVALLPTLITLLIFIKVFSFLNDIVGQYIGRGLTQGVAWAVPNSFYPTNEQVDVALAAKNIKPSSEKFEIERQDTTLQLRQRNMDATAGSWQMSLLGFIVAIVITCVLGFLLASIVGRRLWRLIEVSITQIPGIKQLYPHVKQVTDYFFGEKKITFSKVVAVEYPRVGIWSLGFVTGPAMKCLNLEKGEEWASVFIPTSPTPVTGYVITARWADMRELDLTIDQALRFVISGGVLGPDMVQPKPVDGNSSSTALPPR